MSTRSIWVDYKELNINLNELEKFYPSRIYWDIDLLRANIEDKLFNQLSWNNLIFEIDDVKKMALLWWKEIEWSVYAFPDLYKEPTSSEKMYEQIINAEEEAKKLWFYEKVFKESKD